MAESFFQCTVCGFVFKSSGQNLEADRLISFEALPTTWRCPKCGVLKNLFQSSVNNSEQHQRCSLDDLKESR
ncbi:rubredoxin [Candidatus Dependentiae bacterium]|nr:rubredoxin [Candidatus Dependentiae bacterium]